MGTVREVERMDLTMSLFRSVKNIFRPKARRAGKDEPRRPHASKLFHDDLDEFMEETRTPDEMRDELRTELDRIRSQSQ